MKIMANKLKYRVYIPGPGFDQIIETATITQADMRAEEYRKRYKEAGWRPEVITVEKYTNGQWQKV